MIPLTMYGSPDLLGVGFLLALNNIATIITLYESKPFKD